MKKIIVFILVVLIVALAACTFIFDWGKNDARIPMTDQNTVASDTPDIFSPIDGETVTSPIRISGKVSGNWFFEGSFPVELFDSNGDVIATTTAQTPGDWATTSIIDFSATLVYPKATTTDRGLIMLKNDNPSGNRQLNQEKFIQVILK